MSLRVPKPIGQELLMNNKSALMESILLPESTEPPGYELSYSHESAFYCSQTQSCFNVLIWILLIFIMWYFASANNYKIVMSHKNPSQSKMHKETSKGDKKNLSFYHAFSLEK